MAKNIALEPKKEVVAVEKNLDGSKKVVEVTK